MSSSKSQSQSPLHNLAQSIHATLLSPPRRFLLISTVINEDEWCLTLYVNHEEEGTVVWSTTIIMDEVIPEEMADTISQGLLHVDVGIKRTINLTQVDQVKLHILSHPEPFIVKLNRADTSSHVGGLIDVSFDLLSRPSTPPGVSREKSQSASERDLRTQLVQKDAELASLSARLASMKATVVRATSSDSRKSGSVHASPQKAKPPKGASALQPNQKRRKVVEDEFAGSSDDDDDDDDED